MTAGGTTTSARRTAQGSTGLRVIRAPSAAAVEIVTELVSDGSGRLHLSAGAGAPRWPAWAEGRLRSSTPSGRILAGRFLHCREEREAAIDRAIGAIESWFVGAGDDQARLVLEVIGSPGPDDVRFWQTCRLRLGPADGPPRSMILVLHDPPTGTAADGGPDGAEMTEILSALLLAGGRTTAAELRRWTAARGWDPDRVAGSTSVRPGPGEQWCTFADSALLRRAVRVHRDRRCPAVAELATMVASGGVRVPLTTLALVDRAAVALAGCDTVTAATGANRDGELVRFTRNLRSRARFEAWAAVPEHLAATAHLSALVADRRAVSSSGADLVLRQAARSGIAPGARALIAFHLGQALVKMPNPDARAAAARCFDHVQICDDPEEPAAYRSRTAASFNGAALIRHRLGDRQGAVEVMHAALAALGDDKGDEEFLAQQVLLLTNLAKVHRQDPATRPEALVLYRRAWRTACRAGSMAGLAYVAPDLVRALIQVTEYEEADRAVRTLLRHHDALVAPNRLAEQAVALSCWQLADVELKADDVLGATEWYEAAARRCRYSGAAALDGMMDNLRRHGAAPAAMAHLRAARSAREETAADLAVLRDLVDEHDRD